MTSLSKPIGLPKKLIFFWLSQFACFIIAISNWKVQLSWEYLSTKKSPAIAVNYWRFFSCWDSNRHTPNCFILAFNGSILWRLNLRVRRTLRMLKRGLVRKVHALRCITTCTFKQKSDFRRDIQILHILWRRVYVLKNWRFSDSVWRDSTKGCD